MHGETNGKGRGGMVRVTRAKNPLHVPKLKHFVLGEMEDEGEQIGAKSDERGGGKSISVSQDFINYIGDQQTLTSYVNQQTKTNKAIAMLSKYLESKSSKINVRDSYSFIALEDKVLRRNELVNKILGETTDNARFIESHTFRNTTRRTESNGSITMENLLGQRIVVGNTKIGIGLPKANDCTISSVPFNVYVSAAI